MTGMPLRSSALNHILDELRPLIDDLFVHGLFQADRHRLHLPDGHAAVGEEALEQRHEVAQLSVSLLVVGNNSAPAGCTQFARGKVDDVAQIGNLARDLADRLVLATLSRVLMKYRLSCTGSHPEPA